MSNIIDFFRTPIAATKQHHQNSRKEQAEMEAHNYCFIRDDKFYVNEVTPYQVSLTGDTDMSRHILSFADAMSMVEWYRKKFIEVHFPDVAKAMEA